MLFTRPKLLDLGSVGVWEGSVRLREGTVGVWDGSVGGSVVDWEGVQIEDFDQKIINPSNFGSAAI